MKTGDNHEVGFYLMVVFLLVFLVFLFVRPAEKKKSLTGPAAIAVDSKKFLGDFPIDFGNGLDDFIVDKNTEVQSGEFFYNTLRIKKGVFTIKKINQFGQLIIHAREKIIVEKDGLIDLSGKGLTKGGENFKSAGGGGSHGGRGGTGDCLNKPRLKYMGEGLNKLFTFGEGGGLPNDIKNQEGASGGGLLIIEAPQIIIDGVIVNDGLSGTKNGGGGGAGGKIIILTNKITIRGKILARGGRGGNAFVQGAGGGGGGIVVINQPLSDEVKKHIDVSGGRFGKALDLYSGCDGTSGDDGKLVILK
ncbi:hypothetical protein GYA28_04985 [Candidatus Roizmanbacteria bacterium]|nr:hypothetical protein [Candidatus Roizmanbacteria bacterium]